MTDYTPKTWTTGENADLDDLVHLETQYSLALAVLAAHVTVGHPLVYRPISEMDSYFWHAGNDGDGSGLDADTLEGVHASGISGGIDAGIMGWWYPANGAIPDGYYFCDGNNGTLDMRNRYPIGASASLAVGATIGNSSITPTGSITVGGCTLTVANIFHTHTGADDWDFVQNQDVGSGSWTATTAVDRTVNTSAVGSGGSHMHPGTFTGDAKSLDPVSQYIVIIQKS